MVLAVISFFNADDIAVKNPIEIKLGSAAVFMAALTVLIKKAFSKNK